MRYGFFHLSGASIALSSTLIRPVQTWRLPDFRVVPACFAMPIACKRAVIRIA
jgi:hypothetical protein